MKALRLALFACLACTLAGPGDGQSDARAQGLFTAPYSQPPEMLPRRFRNHCSFDVTLGTFYCSNRCGSDYQF